MAQPLQRDSYSDYANQRRNRPLENPGSRPLGLLQDNRPWHDSFRRGNAGGKSRDDVFFQDSNKISRIDSSGFSFTREHYKKMQNKQRNTESQFVRLFIFNVPKKCSVDEVYDHFVQQEINIVDLWQSSHVDSRKKSFVVKVSKNVANIVMNDKILAELDIGIREYTGRSEN